MSKDLGVVKTYRALKFFLLLSIRSRHGKDCARLVTIGSSDSGRARGFGTKMLSFLRETFRDEGYNFIQLEVEDVNPAKRLYLREGYRVIKQFKTSGVGWSVMVQSL